jgi:hypothetical protein
MVETARFSFLDGIHTQINKSLIPSDRNMGWSFYNSTMYLMILYFCSCSDMSLAYDTVKSTTTTAPVPPITILCKQQTLMNDKKLKSALASYLMGIRGSSLGVK